MCKLKLKALIVIVPNLILISLWSWSNVKSEERQTGKEDLIKNSSDVSGHYIIYFKVHQKYKTP